MTKYVLKELGAPADVILWEAGGRPYPDGWIELPEHYLRGASSSGEH